MICIESMELKATHKNIVGTVTTWDLLLRSDKTAYRANVVKSAVNRCGMVHNVTIVNRVCEVTLWGRIEIPVWDPMFWDVGAAIVANPDFQGKLGTGGRSDELLHVSDVHKCGEVYTVFFEVPGFDTFAEFGAVLVFKDDSFVLWDVWGTTSYGSRTILEPIQISSPLHNNIASYHHVIKRNITRFVPIIKKLAKAKK